MLTNIGADQIRRIADLAREAADAHRRLIGGLRDVDLGDQPKERGSRNPTDLDALNLLEKTANGIELERLRQAIDALEPEARQELKAAVLIGRGDFAPNQWDQAMIEAASIPASTDTDYLVEKLNLHTYLTKALYELKCL